MTQLLTTIIGGVIVLLIKYMFTNRKEITSKFKNLEFHKNRGNAFVMFMTKKKVINIVGFKIETTLDNVLTRFGQSLFIFAVIIALYTTKDMPNYGIVFIAYMVLGSIITFPRNRYLLIN